MHSVPVRYIRQVLLSLVAVFSFISLHASDLYTSLDSVDTQGAVEMDAQHARTEMQSYLPSSLDTDLALLMEAWRSGYASQNRYEVPCGKFKTDNIRALSDSVLISRLKGLPTVIPIPYNAMVKEGIAKYITDRPQLIRAILAMGDYYFPIMEEIFDRNGVPVELIYLTVVESALNPFAVSRAGACGLWQLMLPTGRSLGLTINSLVDERFDVYKSTEAAARYLKQLHGLFDNWLLAIAAYNCGPGNVTKAIRRSGGRETFWGIYPHLPRETRNYVPLYIGAYYACYYHNEHNLCPKEQSMPLSTDTLMVQIPLTFAQISQATGMPLQQIRTLNPQYKRGVIPASSEPYIIRLPLNAISKLDHSLITLRKNHKEQLYQQIEEAKEEILQAPPSKVDTPKKEKSKPASTKTYKVRKGDSLYSIAKKHGVSVDDLKKANGIKGKKTKLKPGQKLKIPRKSKKKR